MIYTGLCRDILISNEIYLVMSRIDAGKINPVWSLPVEF